ncbi:hypothetical protein B0I37DRAFT_302393 [Chaetomium sp. MPI-CAGE-AT-0009]|nr:hypothetical protein B0I37DRAFT_302393 [Chaetomium sp. MPI-CAGE-AT-0009]
MWHRNECYPTTPCAKSYKDEWTEVMNRIQSHTNIREASATFLSCCRRPATHDTWMPYTQTPEEDAKRLQSYCLDLEGHFASLLATCRNVDTVTLRGNVPPSLAIRIEDPDMGLGLSLQAVSKYMAAFIKGAVKETEERDSNDPSWAKKTPYPPLRYHPATTPPPHFVLGRTRPETATWSWLEERIRGNGTATGMELVSGPLCSGTWETASEVLDYKNLVVGDDSEVARGWRSDYVP